jgi:DNA-3-methyladenine glycosylase II
VIRGRAIGAARRPIATHFEGRSVAALVTDPHTVLARDDHLGPVVETHGPVTIEPAEDFFRRFVVSIVRQQVSTASAEAIRERLFEQIEVTPTGVLAAEEAVLREAGLSEQKTRYVQNVAATFDERDWDRSYFAGRDDDAVRDELTSITGVGTWTADMQLIFALGREDVFPVGDLGIRRGMRRCVGEDLDRADMVAHAERWQPYRSYASLYLWRVSDGE